MSTAESSRWLWPPGATSAPPDGSQLGSLLRGYRDLRGLTQSELAGILAVSQPQLSRIENGTRRVRDVAELRRIAARLDLPLDQLGVLPDRSDDRVPEARTVSTDPGALHDSQQRWRAARRALAAHRLELTPVAAQLYPGLPRVAGVRRAVRAHGRGRTTRASSSAAWTAIPVPASPSNRTPCAGWATSRWRP